MMLATEGIAVVTAYFARVKGGDIGRKTNQARFGVDFPDSGADFPDSGGNVRRTKGARLGQRNVRRTKGARLGQRGAVFVTF